MMDAVACHLALRSRALSATVATTGSISLAATATGYTRATGSFLSDGFAVGMDVTSTGFGTAANNAHGVVTAVAALTLSVSPYVVTVSGGVQSVTRAPTVTEAADVGRTITAALPSMRAWENTAPVGLTAFQPAPGIPYIADEYTPASAQLLGQRHGGALYEPGLYVVRWVGLAGSGITALRRSVDAVKRLFAPGTTLTMTDGNVVRVRSDYGPVAGAIVEQGNGFAVLECKVYWSAESVNAVAA